VNPNTLPHSRYRPDIDGLRAFAVLSVVGFHAFPGWFRGGFVGVDVFFVISGYLISRIIFSGVSTGQFSFIDFYSRRIKRIFPALILVLLSFILIGWWVMLAGEYAQLGKHTAAGAGFISNLVFWQESGYFDNTAISKPLLHLWSLGIEEQFYILWPVIIWLAYRNKLNMIYLIILLALISFALNIQIITTDVVATFFSPQTRFWELLCGSMLGWMSVNNNRFNQSSIGLSKDWQSVVGAALLVASGLLISDKSLFPGWWALLPVMGTSLLIGAGPHAWVNRVVLSRKFCVWFGLISFPLYLWHWPLLSFAYVLENQIPSSIVRIGVVALSIGLAAATYYFMEKPLRQGKGSVQLTILLCALMAVIACAGLFIFKDQGIQNREVVQANLRPTDGAVYQQNPSVPCSDSSTYPIVSNLCVKYVAEGSKRNIVLWGDSSTGAWLPVFLDIAAKNNISLIHVMHLSCPPILDARKSVFNFEESRKYCSDGKTQHEVLQLIKDVKPEATVLIAAWNAYSEYSNREFITDSSVETANAQTTKRVMSQKLPETLSELAKISKTVVFESWPMLATEPKARKLSFVGFDTKLSGIKKEEFDNDVRSIRQVLHQAQSQNQNLVLFDPAEKICLQNECLSEIDGVNYYLDKYHITPKGSMQFAEEIERFLN
jgi:peptidoglycan/LPS O-acetylase OafA/YrhL